jgi:hypothetical protein
MAGVLEGSAPITESSLSTLRVLVHANWNCNQTGSGRNSLRGELALVYLALRKAQQLLAALVHNLIRFFVDISSEIYVPKLPIKTLDSPTRLSM